MAVLNYNFLNYIIDTLTKGQNQNILHADYILHIGEHIILKQKNNIYLPHCPFCNGIQEDIEQLSAIYAVHGILGIVKHFYKNIINNSIEKHVERKIIALKHGFKRLPATTATIILNGFDIEISQKDVHAVYASYGLSRNLKEVRNSFDFFDINSRASMLSTLVNIESIENSTQKRYEAMRSYALAPHGKKEQVLSKLTIKRSTFFYYWKNFSKYGFIGLVDKGKEIFRKEKISLENEATIVIDKIQNPERTASYYVSQLQYKNISVTDASIQYIFSRWSVNSFNSKFISNLSRLENPIDTEEEQDESFTPKSLSKSPSKMIDRQFKLLLDNSDVNGQHIDSPGIFILWAYLEELGIYEILNQWGLAFVKKGYAWFDYFLLSIVRIFYGIPTYSQTCQYDTTTLPFFAHLVNLPSESSFINGLDTISEKQVFSLQKWLVKRGKELGLITGKHIAFDFHHIDLDVIFSKLRKIGKGYSPKKKICANGLRPHIAWDLDTNSLIVIEFRKASARGTTTFKGFVKDFLLKEFKDIFVKVYVDSEYTGKNSWEFIADMESGMGCSLTACLKQNPLVRKKRNAFLYKYQSEKKIWCYWDDEHVFSSKTFTISWTYKSPLKNKFKNITLYCVVKKNIKNGKLRCFGTFDKNKSSKDILIDYSVRWMIENGIKDLIKSYYLDKCPGERPHLVNIHFMIVMVCRMLYRMVQRDSKKWLTNPDGTMKTLSRMRDFIFRKGIGTMKVVNKTIEIYFMDSFSPQITENLKQLYKKIQKRHKEGLNILGGYSLKFILQPPFGEERKNDLTKVPIQNENF